MIRLVLGVVLFAIAAGLRASPVTTVQEAAASAIRTAPEYQEYRAALVNAEAQKLSALWRVLPSAEAYGTHAQSFSETSRSDVFFVNRSNFLGLAISVPLVQPGGWAGMQASFKAGEAARFVFNDRVDNLAFRAASALVNWIGTINRLAIAQRRCASLARSCDGVRTRAAAGDLTTIDLHQAEAALFSAQAFEASLRADSMAAAEEVFVICGAYPSPTAVFPQLLLALSPTADTTVEAPAVSAARLSQESAAMNVRAAVLGRLPTLSVNGSSGLGADERISNGLWVHRGELRLSQPIPPNPTAHSTAKAAKTIADSRYAAAVRDNRSLQRTLSYLYGQNITSLALYVADSTAAAAAAAGREAAFLAGTTTVTEFLNAQNGLYSACENLWSARTAAASTGLSLLLASGSLRAFLQIKGNP